MLKSEVKIQATWTKKGGGLNHMDCLTWKKRGEIQWVERGEHWGEKVGGVLKWKYCIKGPTFTWFGRVSKKGEESNTGVKVWENGQTNFPMWTFKKKGGAAFAHRFSYININIRYHIHQNEKKKVGSIFTSHKNVQIWLFFIYPELFSYI